MTDESYTGKNRNTRILFLGGETSVSDRTDKSQSTNPTALYKFGNTNTSCRKCTQGSHGLTICVILHPFIDLSSNSCTLAEIYILYFSFKVFFHQLQEFVTDMKPILHVEGVGDVQHVVTFSSSCHVRKVLQEGKLFTWGKKKQLQWFRKGSYSMDFLLKIHKDVLCEGKSSF